MKFKLKRLIKSPFWDQLAYLLSLIMAFSGITLFMTGFHNVDICSNEKIIQETYNQDCGCFIGWEEERIDGRIWSLDECYLSGIKSMFSGIFITAAGFFLLGFNSGRQNIL